MDTGSPRRGVVVVRGILALAVIVAAGLVLEAQQPTFRAGVDLVAVDVQVVTGQGLPILGLGSDAFEVSINRRRRRVVSADLLSFDSAVAGAERPATVAPLTTIAAPTLSDAAENGRIFVLAVDLMSFPPSSAREVINAAQKFVESLQPNDMVGLFAYPNGPPLELTTSHASVVGGLERVIGSGDPPSTAMNRYQLLPSEIVDLTALRSRDPRDPPTDPELQRRIAEICGADREPRICERFVVSDAHALAAFEEGQVLQRLAAMRAMLGGLAMTPRRKTIVLMSTGILATDRAGGRPDLEDLGTLIGQDAARANATIYSLYVDRRAEVMSASSVRRSRPTDNFSRDSAIMSRSLDLISGASGGTVFSALQGGVPAFDRILKETSAYYLLGVEPDEADRDGRPRTLSVKANTGQRGTTVRARSWVVIPKR